MFRTASRLPRRAILSATLAGTAFGIHESPEKLSIYSTPTPDILLVEDPSTLEKQIGVVRRQASQVYRTAHGEVQSWVSKWIGVEHAVENRVKSITSPTEPLTPGVLYVGVATLTGSILARNRFLPTRLLLPPVLLLASAHHFLPQTTRNISDYLGSLEDTYLPTVSQKHEVAKAHTAMGWERLKEATGSGREAVNRGAAGLVEKVQEATGLKLKETLGWVDVKEGQVSKIVEKAVEEVKPHIEQKVEAVEQKVEQIVEKVEEVKRQV